MTDYKELFDRVSLDLGGVATNLPTNELLNGYKTNASDGEKRSLEALFFQYGRYLLIASSREGSLPANLQGVWNQVNNPPWNSDYHTNINVQMNYWPSEVVNLAETDIPYIDYIDSCASRVGKQPKDIMELKGKAGRFIPSTTHLVILRQALIFIGAGHRLPTPSWCSRCGIAMLLVEIKIF